MLTHHPLLTIKHSTKKGFSLIEVILAFSILTITVISSTSLISTSIQNNQENILRTQAFFLAQEGLELTRAYRDTSWLQEYTENQTFPLPDGKYTIEYPSTITQNLELSPVTQVSPKLYLDPQGKFTHSSFDSSSNSVFSREITISAINNLDGDTGFQSIASSNQNSLKTQNFTLQANSKKVTSTVSYEFKGKEKSIILTTILTNWKPI